ncbi:hypothetical protein I4U23_030449 [Adineta vaga]|nr:hypothetical protein I4U23_030449 [Adineta vaga]
MNIVNKYRDEQDEFLHPFWLGILILLVVITVLSILCFIRKKCGSQIEALLKSICCGNNYNIENRSKRSKQSSLTAPYSWAPTYNPAHNISPKLYTLVRNIQMNSFEREASIQQNNTIDETVEHDIFTIPDESEQMKTALSQKSSQTNQDRNCETARKFYASMRQPSQCQTSSSLDSGNNDSSLKIDDRINQTNGNDHSKFLRNIRFFQSIEKNIH